MTSIKSIQAPPFHVTFENYNSFVFLITVKSGSPHYYRMPRVVLIAKQFALSTATDAAVVPAEYAL